MAEALVDDERNEIRFRFDRAVVWSSITFEQLAVISKLPQ